jgi:hypothetical protein
VARKRKGKRVLLVEDDSATAHSIELIEQVRVNLTGKEYRMLELLSLRRGTTITNGRT